MSGRTAHILEQKWRSDDIRIGEDADFSSLLLPKELLKGLAAAGFKNPSPIQLKAIPVGKIGKDLLVQAKSGTGKTLVFSVIALNMVLEKTPLPQVLIMAPTREIACQICQVIKSVAVAYKNFACEYFIGGRRLEEDMPRIQGCQVVVGTPGRIKQMINTKILQTKAIRLFVLDEADQLLKESSFTTDIDDIFRALPRDKQMIATSATYPDRLKKLTDKYFRDPLLIRLNKNDIGLLGMVHYYHVIPVSKLPVVAYKKKLKCLEDVLLNVKFAQCLVFCNMVSRVENLCVEIKNWGFATSFISSARGQDDRLKAIELLKRFKCKVLVSSDVSARGIDAENVDLVINFDLPAFLDTYFHRVGRAGRYGSKCASITFITSDEIDAYQQMQRNGKFTSFPLPDHVPSGLISIQPKMKHVVNDELLPVDDGTESSSDSSLDSDDLEQKKTNKEKRKSKNPKLNGHNGLCASEVDDIVSKNLVDQFDKIRVDAKKNAEARISNGTQISEDDSNSASSAKEDDNLSSTSESMEQENNNSTSSVSVEGGESTAVYSSNEIPIVERENDEFDANESTKEESVENSLLVNEVLAGKNPTAFEENAENLHCEEYLDNIHELQPIADTSSCLADIESICEKTVHEKLNKVSNVSKLFKNPDSEELVSSVVTFMKTYEDLNKEAEDYFTTDSGKSSQILDAGPSEKISAASLSGLRSSLAKFQYNVCTNFIKDISEDMNKEIAHRHEGESDNHSSDIKTQHCLKQKGENKINSSGLDSRNVLFSTPKGETIAGSKSGHSSGQETSSGSDKDKLIEHFNSMVGSIDKIKPSSNKNFTSDSSSSSELNSDTSVNSKNAMYRLTKEFNKAAQKGAGGLNKETNNIMRKSNFINNTELSSSSSFSGTSVDSENADDELEKELNKLINVQKGNKSSNKDSNETKEVLQKIKGRKSYFEDIEIVDSEKHAMSSSNSTSDSEYSDTKKHVESSIDSSSDSNISKEINKKKVAASNKSSKSSCNKTKTRNSAAQHSKESSSGTKRINKNGKLQQTDIMKGHVRNKIDYDYSETSSSETESYIDQYAKDSHSSSKKIHRKEKPLRVKTKEGPAQNKITYYYSQGHSTTDSDIDQNSMKSQSSLHDLHQRKLKTLKTKPPQFNYSHTEGTLGYSATSAGEGQTFNSSQSYYPRQPTNYAVANPYYSMQPTNHAMASNPNQQMQPINYVAANTNYQVQPTNNAGANIPYQPFPEQIQSLGNPGLPLGTQCGHQMTQTSYMFNPYHQSYPQAQNNANYGLFPSNPYYPYPCECPLKESCQMQPSGSGHASGYVQSNYNMSQNFNYNQCYAPSQHPCHPPNETCQSPACAAWYDIFCKQWQFLNKPPYF